MNLRTKNEMEIPREPTTKVCEVLRESAEKEKKANPVNVDAVAMEE